MVVETNMFVQELDADLVTKVNVSFGSTSACGNAFLDDIEILALPSLESTIWALMDAVMDPIETHVNGMGALLFDAVIGD